MYNFVFVENWNQYTFQPTNDTVSEDNKTALYDGTGYNLCGDRLYYIESVTGGVLSHTTVDELVVDPIISVRATSMYYHGE